MLQTLQAVAFAIIVCIPACSVVDTDEVQEYSLGDEGGIPYCTAPPAEWDGMFSEDCI